MSDEKLTHQERLKRALNPQGQSGTRSKEPEGEETEVSCGAFGYLRGIRDLPGSVEFRFRDGNSAWFPYGWLGPWKYNPSEGLLLKFSGDMVYIVLIRGSNLDKPLNEGAINLTTGGLQRNRVVWIREMSKEDIEKVGDSGPTIDSIQVEEFVSQDAVQAWLKTHAPAFVRVAHQVE
jgi:YD repeat-containing protein